MVASTSGVKSLSMREAQVIGMPAMQTVSFSPMRLPFNTPLASGDALTSTQRTMAFSGSSSGLGRAPTIRTAGVTSRTGSGNWSSAS